MGGGGGLGAGEGSRVSEFFTRNPNKIKKIGGAGGRGEGIGEMGARVSEFFY